MKKILVSILLFTIFGGFGGYFLEKEHPIAFYFWVSKQEMLKRFVDDRDIDNTVKILNKGANPDTPLFYDGKSALTKLASKSYRQTILEVVARYTNNIDHRDDNGYTALEIAVTYGKYENVKVLLMAGSKATLEDQDGLTPLMYASKLKSESAGKIIDVLKDNGADIIKKNNAGNTAFDVATEHHGSIREVPKDVYDKLYPYKELQRMSGVNVKGKELLEQIFTAFDSPYTKRCQKVSYRGVAAVLLGLGDSYQCGSIMEPQKEGSKLIYTYNLGTGDVTRIYYSGGNEEYTADYHAYVLNHLVTFTYNISTNPIEYTKDNLIINIGRERIYKPMRGGGYSYYDGWDINIEIPIEKESIINELSNYAHSLELWGLKVALDEAMRSR